MAVRSETRRDAGHRPVARRTKTPGRERCRDLQPSIRNALADSPTTKICICAVMAIYEPLRQVHVRPPVVTLRQGACSIPLDGHARRGRV